MGDDDAELWAELLGYCGDPSIAADVFRAGPESLELAIPQLDRKLGRNELSILDFTAIEGDVDAIRASLDTLARLAPDDRIGEMRSNPELMIPLRDSTPVPVNTRTDVAVPRSAVAVAAVLLIAISVLGLANLARGPDPQAATPPTTVALAPSSTTVGSTSPGLPPRLTDPDRVVVVELTEDGVVVRRDPATGDLVWRSQRFSDPVGIRVDGDIVRVQRQTRRPSFLSLTDGTHLPP